MSGVVRWVAAVVCQRPTIAEAPTKSATLRRTIRLISCTCPNAFPISAVRIRTIVWREPGRLVSSQGGHEFSKGRSNRS